MSFDDRSAAGPAGYFAQHELAARGEEELGVQWAHFWVRWQGGDRGGGRV